MKTNNKQKLVLSLAAIMAAQTFPLSTFAVEPTKAPDKDIKPVEIGADVKEDKKDVKEDKEVITANAQAVIDGIKKLPVTAKITLDDEAGILKLRASYDSLTDVEKKSVTNITDLEKAEAKIKDEKDKDNAHKKEIQEQQDKEAITNYQGQKIKFVNGVKNGRVTIEIPKAKAGYFANVSVSDKNSGASLASKEGIRNDAQMEVAYLGANKTYSVSLEVIREADNRAVGNVKIDLASPEIKAPSLKYAYVYDGGLVVNIQSDAGIDSIYWAYKGEKDFRKLPEDAGYGKQYNAKRKDATYLGTKTEDFSNLFKEGQDMDKYTRLDKNDFRINVKIPSTVDIVAIDKLGNKTPISIKVKKDNVALTKDVPTQVEKALKENNNFSYQNKDKYKDLVVIEKNTVVDMFSVFEDYIADKLGSFNTRDLEWTSPELKDKIPYTGLYKFTNDGVYRVEVRDAESKKTCQITVVVNSGANNVRDYKLENKEVKIEKDKFKPIEALKITTYDDKEVNPVHFVAIVNDQYYKITDEIEFKDKDGKDVDSLKVKIVNLKDDKTFDVTFIKGVLAGSADFDDIDKCWAKNMIIDLAKKGVVAGYGDKKFKPDNMITIRETLAIVGRHAGRNKDKAGKEINKFTLIDAKDDKNWSYKDINYAASTMPENIFKGKDITKEAITREEVAYLMKYVYNIDTKSKDAESKLTDVDKSKYEKEVTTLIGAGVINGYPDKTFRPDLQITRAELVSLLYNLPGTWK